MLYPVLLCWITTVLSAQTPASYAVSTIAGAAKNVTSPSPAQSVHLIRPSRTAIGPNNTVYLSEAGGARIWRVLANGQMEVVAGNGTAGFSGDGGPATAAGIRSPRGLAFDTAGNLYIADEGNHRIRKVTTAGTITTIAGSGTAGFAGDGGPAIAARLNTPRGVAVDPAGNVYVADMLNNRVRRVALDGVITTYLGTGTAGLAPNNTAATSAAINSPQCVGYRDARLYFCDTGNHRVGYVSQDGLVTNVIGTGQPGFGGVTGLAGLYAITSPTDIALAPNQAIAVATGGRGGRIIAATVGGAAFWFAGSGAVGFAANGAPTLNAAFDGPSGIAVDAALAQYVPDSNNNRVVKIANGSVTNFAGASSTGPEGAEATSAQLMYPTDAVAGAGGEIYIADQFNLRIRVLGTDGTLRTFSGGGNGGATASRATDLTLGGPSGLSISTAGDVLFTDNSLRIFRVTTQGVSALLAGTGIAGFSGDGGPSTAAQFTSAAHIAVDAKGNIFFSDENRVRRIDSGGRISTVAGTGVAGSEGDGGLATAARLNGANGLCIDSNNNLYISDLSHRVRRVSAEGIITTVAGSGVAGIQGDGGPAVAARLNRPAGLTIDADGGLFIADSGNHRIRYVAPNGVISTIAGTGTAGFSGDNGPALDAQFNFPNGVSRLANGSLIVADFSNHRIRKLTPNRPSVEVPVIRAVTGAARSDPPSTGVSPNGMLLLSGDRFAPEGTQAKSEDSAAKLAGVCVEESGVVIPIVEVSSREVVVIAPATLGAEASFQIVANCGEPGESRSEPYRVAVQEAAPEFLYWSTDGFPIMAVGEDGAAIRDGVTAKAGALVIANAIGLGALDASSVAVMIGDTKVTVDSVVSTKPGVYGIQFHVPQDASEGNAVITLLAGERLSPQGTLAISK